MILTRKRLLVAIFLTRRLSKALAFCEFASVNFEPWTVREEEASGIIYFSLFQFIHTYSHKVNYKNRKEKKRKVENKER